MSKLKKSDLRTHLQQSIQILKRKLDYMSYCYLILAVLFFSYGAGINPTFSRSLILSQHPASTLVRDSGKGTQRRREDAYDDFLQAFSTFEYSNPPLKGVLVPALAKSLIADATLDAYQSHVAALAEASPVFSDSQSFVHAYDYWIEQLAMATTKQGVSFYTQRALARLLVEITKPADGMSIYDPTAGTGGLLVAAAEYVRQHGNSGEALRIYGREKVHSIWAICKMNLMVHQLWNSTVEQCDTLEAPADLYGTFDLVLQDMPLAPDQRTGRQQEAAFLRHAVQMLAPQGKAALLAPSGIVQHDHREFVRSIVTRDWLEAVISLPPRLLHGTHSGAYLWILNKQKPAERRAHVLFIDASGDHVPHGTRYNTLKDGDAARIVNGFEAWKNVRDFARVVPSSQIETQNYNLSVSRYVGLIDTPTPASVLRAANRYKEAVQQRDQAIQRLTQTLKGLDISITDESDQTW